MPVVPYYLGPPAQAWIAAMSGSARATTGNSCAATSLATGTFPASERPAVPTAQRKTQEEASPRSHGRNRQRLGGLGKPLVHPRTAAPSVLTAADRARGEAAIDGDDAGTVADQLADGCRVSPDGGHSTTVRTAELSRI
jgi:hypothetical protein